MTLPVHDFMKALANFPNELGVVAQPNLKHAGEEAESLAIINRIFGSNSMTFSMGGWSNLWVRVNDYK